MKTAILAACTGRSIEYTIENLTKNLFNCFEDRDIFIYLKETTETEKVLEKFKDLESVNFLVQKEDDLDISNYKFQNMWPPSNAPDYEKGRKIYINMIQSRKVLSDMLINSKNNYERCIFSRLDVVYEKSLSEIVSDLEIKDDTVYIPNFHNYGGLNDRFSISSKKGMVDYLCLYDSLLKMTEEGHEIHAETTLLKFLTEEKKKKIVHIPVRFARIRNGEVHDSFNERFGKSLYSG